MLAEIIGDKESLVDGPAILNELTPWTLVVGAEGGGRGTGGVEANFSLQIDIRLVNQNTGCPRLFSFYSSIINISRSTIR